MSNSHPSFSYLSTVFFLLTPIIWRRYRHHAKSLPLNNINVTLLNDISQIQRETLYPGLVLLRNALSMKSQLLLAEKVFEYGHQKRKWWSETIINKQKIWMLNNYRQGRGRIYDSLKNFPVEELFRRVCLDSVVLARSIDSAMPDIDPTHLLVLYYTADRKLGWHRDNGAQDGQSDCPVVSISLGNSCDFLYRDFDNNSDDGMGIKKLQLNSGDILLFGGPSRHIQHSVSRIHMSTCPQQLQDLHLEGVRGTTHVPGVPSEAFVQHPPNSFRLNLTYRHAPELFGKENEERFYFFAKSARKFLDLARQLGVARAREVANETRQAKNHKAKKK